MGPRRRTRLTLMFVWLLCMSIGCLNQREIPGQAPIAVTPEPLTVRPSLSFPTLPPSATASPAPSQTPAIDIASEVGEIVFQDDFSEDRGWEFHAGLRDSASLFDGKYVIAVNRPGAVALAVAPIQAVGDFYAEVQVRTDLCEEGDEFGLIYRVDAALNHYRFAHTCEGRSRVSRFVGGVEAALVPLTQTFALRARAPADNRIAVWARGDRFKLFINDLEVFDVHDGQLPAGGIGLLVWSRRSGHTTVAFDEFKVYSLKPQETPTQAEAPTALP